MSMFAGGVSGAGYIASIGLMGDSLSGCVECGGVGAGQGPAFGELEICDIWNEGLDKSPKFGADMARL